MILEGLLVDLVPFGARFEAREHDWLNGEGVFYWAVGGRWFVTQAGLERDRAEDRANTHLALKFVRFGVQTKDGTPIGLFGVNHLDSPHRLGMLTAMIGEPAYWGGGYGTDALLLTMDYAFRWLDMRKLWLMTMSLNARVIRQMEKVGFALEARCREATWADNAWADMLCFGMMREQWPGRAAIIERIGLHAQPSAQR